MNSYLAIKRMTKHCFDSHDIFSRLQYRLLIKVLSRDTVLKSLINRYPPEHFEKIFIRSSECYKDDVLVDEPRAVAVQRDVHDEIFSTLRLKARLYLMTLPSSQGNLSFDRQKLMNSTYREQLLTWFHQPKEFSGSEKKRSQLMRYINFIFDEYEKQAELNTPLAGAELVVYAMQWCDAAETQDELDSRRKLIESVLLESMTAYKGEKHQYYKDIDYSCIPGLEDRLLDIIGTVHETLSSPVISQRATEENHYVDLLCQEFFKTNCLEPSALFYSLYVQARTEDYSLQDTEHQVIAVNPELSLTAMQWLQWDFTQHQYNDLTKSYQVLLSITKEDLVLKGSLLAKLNTYLATNETGEVLFPYVLKAELLLKEQLKNEFHQKIEFHCQLPYPFEQQNQSAFFRRYPHIFIPKIETVKVLSCLEHSLPDDQLLLQRMATSSELSIYLIETMIAILPQDGFQTFHALFEEEYAECLPWSKAQIQFQRLKNKLLGQGKKIFEDRPQTYFGHIVEDRHLRSLIGRQMSYQDLEDITLLCPDFVLAQSISRLTLDQRLKIADLCTIEGFPQTLEKVLLMHPKIHPDDLNTEYEDPLIIKAASYGYSQVVRVLLAVGVQSHRPGLQGITGLNKAIFNNDLETTHAFLEHGMQLNAPSTLNRYTALHFACEHNYPKIVDLLMQYGADSMIRTLYAESALDIVVRKGSIEILKILVDYGIDIKAFTYQYLDQRDPCLLLKQVKGEAVFPHHVAAQSGYQSMIEILMSSGFFPDNQDNFGWNALHYAARGGCASVVTYLIKNGFSLTVPNHDDHTPLDIAIINGRQQVVSMLVDDYGPSILQHSNREGQTLLHLAARYGQEHLISFLLLQCPDLIDRQDNDGITPLHLAVQTRQSQAVALLLEQQADKNAVTNDQSTALHFTIQQNDFETMSLLSHAQVNVDIPNHKGQNALHLAVEHNFKKGILEIISRIKDLNHQDDQGLTALHYAAKMNNNFMIKLLLNKNAAVDRVSMVGQLACDFSSNKYLLQRTLNQALLAQNKKMIIHVLHRIESLTLFKNRIEWVQQAFELQDPEIIALFLKKDGCSKKELFQLAHPTQYNLYEDLLLTHEVKSTALSSSKTLLLSQVAPSESAQNHILKSFR